MKPKLQPELHPDADTLNAFAERALPEPERARVLAHLGDCARCRETIYLAQAAAGAETVPAPQVTSQPGWIATAFGRWRVALIPAAALAAVGLAVLWFQLHPAPPHTEMAQMVSPPAAPTAPATPAHSVMPIPPPAAPTPIRRGHKTRTASGTGLAATEEVAQNEPVPTPSASMAVQAPPASAFDARSAADLAQSRMNHEWQKQAVISPGAASRAFLAGRVRLPSGLMAVSSAALLHRWVAIDSTGSVFLSQDGGKHWEPVHPLWAGKAIRVEAPPVSLDAISAGTQPVPSEPVRLAVPTVPGRQKGNVEPSPAPDQAEASPPVPPMLFRLVTDRHRTWVSADGRLWREQP